jgi:hypothetical protein
MLQTRDHWRKLSGGCARKSSLEMNWPYLKNVAGIVLLIVILGGLLFVMYQDQIRNTNYGFGPEWECISQPNGGTACIKRP